MLTTPTIKLFYEVGKRVAVKAKGVSALILATGIGAAVVTAAQNLAQASRKAQNVDSDLITLRTVFRLI